MAENKQTLTQEIIHILKDNAEENSEGYTGAEWIEAADLISQLPKKTVLAIPWCAFDIELDEFGEAIKELRYSERGERNDLDEDGKVDPDWQPEPRRTARYDVLAILIWIPMKREEPDITLDEVKGLMNDENLRVLTRKVYFFWCPRLLRSAEQAEEKQADSDVKIAASEKEEGEGPGNFQE